MVQKEVGERLVALPGNKNYSSLSVFVQSFCKVDIIAQIHKGNFFPTPAVDSVLVSILPFSQFSSDYLHYSKFLKSVFSMRRKNFLKVIKKIYGKESVNKIISRFEISSLARPEEIPPQLFKEIYITLLRTN
jgi:16S rRNA (adenine1518-N6/adenine1519-N6)-dimethyltransferase